MALEDIVNVNVTTATQTPTKVGFGTPAIVAYHTKNTDRVRSYTSTAALVADGFATTDPVYLIAAAMFAQNPRPVRVKVIRRTNPFTQTIDVTPAAPSNGLVYKLTVAGQVATYTATGVDTLATVCTALAAAINALAVGVTASGASGTKVTCTSAAGVLKSFAGAQNATLLDQTTAPAAIATDLDAARTVDDDWYGFVLDSQGAAEITAARTWAEAQKKIFLAQSGDDACANAGSTTDILYTTKAAAPVRTALFYQPSIALDWLAAGLLGKMLPQDPGSATWAYKSVAGVTAYALTDTQKQAVWAKNGNTYTTVAGLNLTEQGKTSAGEYIDVTVGVDWLTARMKERLLFVLANNGKLPYTDDSGDLLGSEISAQLAQAVTAKVLAASPAPAVFVPKVADQATTDRAARYFPGIRFTGRLAGAVHKLDIAGTVSA